MGVYTSHAAIHDQRCSFQRAVGNEKLVFSVLPSQPQVPHSCAVSRYATGETKLARRADEYGTSQTIYERGPGGTNPFNDDDIGKRQVFPVTESST